MPERGNRVARAGGLLTRHAWVGPVVCVGVIVGVVAAAGVAWVWWQVRQVSELYVVELTDAEYAQNRERAERLIAALGEYHTVHSEYPPALDGLVPGFVDAVPPPLGEEREWTYKLHEGGYTIGFVVGPSYEGDWYDTREGAWYEDR